MYQVCYQKKKNKKRIYYYKPEKDKYTELKR